MDEGAGPGGSFARSGAYMNNASSAPMPEESVRAVCSFMEAHSAAGPDSPAADEMVSGAARGARGEVAAAVGCRPEELALTGSATDGINAVAGGISVPEGSHVLVRGMEHEHHSNLYPWLRLGAGRIRSLGIDGDGLFDMGELRRTVREGRTALAVLSHALYNTGAVMPVEEAGEVLEAEHVPYFVDAAQTVGCLGPLDAGRMRCDFMAFNGSKWLCGPMGTGMLYCRRGSEGLLEPLAVGGESAVSYREGGSGAPRLAHKEAPDRFQAGFRNYAGVAGLESSARLLRGRGLGRVRREASRLADSLRDALSGAPGVRLYGPADPERRTSIVPFTVAGREPADVVSRLAAAGVVLAVREMGERKVVRASPHFFNTDEHVAAAARLVRGL